MTQATGARPRQRPAQTTGAPRAPRPRTTDGIYLPAVPRGQFAEDTRRAAVYLRDAATLVRFAPRKLGEGLTARDAEADNLSAAARRLEGYATAAASVADGAIERPAFPPVACSGCDTPTPTDRRVNVWVTADRVRPGVPPRETTLEDLCFPCLARALAHGDDIVVGPYNPGAVA